MKKQLQQTQQIAIIIGTTKGGTTSLFQYLSHHPEVCPSKKKELNFFSGQNWERGLDWYFDNWEWNPACHQTLLEASPLYTKFPDDTSTSERMARHLPHARLIYLVRDPIDRIESHIIMAAANNYLHSLEPLHVGLLQPCRYYRHLENFLAHYSHRQILVLRSEDLLMSPDMTMNQICSFLGLARYDWSVHKYTKFHSRENWLPYLHPAYNVMKSLHLKGISQRLHRHLPSTLQTALMRLVAHKNVPELTDAEKSYVIETLREEMDLLSHTFNVSLKDWQLDTTQFKATPVSYRYFKLD